MPPLTEPQIAAFERDGFVRVDQVFTPDEMDLIDAAMERVHDLGESLIRQGRISPGQGSATAQGSRFTFALSDAGLPVAIRHVSWCGGCEPVLDAFGRDARLLSIAADLLGADEADQLINQAHYKRPGSGISFAWHQDSRHRGAGRGGFVDVNGRGSYVQIALAVDDMTPDNGPLSFIPGSHRMGHIDDDGIPADRLDESRAVSPLLRRGDAAAFGPYTIHGSGPNLSAHPRRVFINGFAFPGANRKDYGLPGAGRRLMLHG
jgi:ectoine hydroxylase-related dioxygenase (phytanoyl-CoA dioxygenase family)